MCMCLYHCPTASGLLFAHSYKKHLSIQWQHLWVCVWCVIPRQIVPRRRHAVWHAVLVVRTAMLVTMTATVVRETRQRLMTFGTGNAVTSHILLFLSTSFTLSLSFPICLLISAYFPSLSCCPSRHYISIDFSFKAVVWLLLCGKS